MPDPLLYLAAIGAAALAAALLVAVLGWPRRADKRGDERCTTRQRVAVVLGLAAGLAAGYWVLDLYVSWPAVNALDRFLTIILPASIVVELLAAFERAPRWLPWTLRTVLVAVTGRVLLDGSIYLSGSYPGWQIALLLGLCASLTAALWVLLSILAARLPRGISLPIALAVAMVVSGFLIMVSGYVSGGAATLPLSATLIAAASVNAIQSRRPHIQAPLGIGVVGLSSLLFIGRLFGGLSTPVAVALLLAPLLCWAPQLFLLFRRNRVAEDRHG
jgi:hypothetical protein